MNSAERERVLAQMDAATTRTATLPPRTVTPLDKEGRPFDISDRLAQWAKLKVGDIPTFTGMNNWSAELNADIVKAIAEITRLRENLADAYQSIGNLQRDLAAPAPRPWWRRWLA